MLKSLLASSLIAATSVVALNVSSSADSIDSPQGSWEECHWNGVRWNSPCAYDHKHTSKGTESFLMFARSDGSIKTETVSHALAHYLLGK